MKINASTSCGDLYSDVEIEYDAEKEKEFEQAQRFVSCFLGVPVEVRQTCEEIGEKILDKLKNTSVDIVKD